MAKTAEAVIKLLKKEANPQNVAMLQRFFKTGPGQYGEGDVFVGLRNPQVRAAAKENPSLPNNEIAKLVKHKVHEYRFLGLVMWMNNYNRKTTNATQRQKIYDLFMEHKQYVNGWDLVDCTVPSVVGKHLFQQDPLDKAGILTTLADSSVLWDRRIAILASFWWIRQGSLDMTIKLSNQLVNDEHDLIHKV
eukprot:TRINITY_DN66442_c3_g1_i2.p1 TRINITY_DN66442_c3_g1~~TRINITY_DN66442_c3_g1_i2.p1  ORF type:complete len:191 (+),score=27.17 TRINITY_DN66442_c3_g1_i2:181-753(+)